MTQLTRSTEPPALGSIVLDRSTSRRAIMRLADLNQLTKPRIAVMVALTTGVGFGLGIRAATAHGLAAANFSWLTLMAALVGTAMSCMSASVLNQVCEVDADARMNRTKDRPLPTGRVSVLPAMGLGVALALAGVTTLALWTTPLAAMLSAVTIVSYVMIYTPMKRISHVSTIIGAIPGALPPVIGYTAACGVLGTEAAVVFAIMFLWQLPHFLAIAWLYREDYARGGFPLLCVLDPTGSSTFRQILLGSLVLVPLGLLPAMVGFAGTFYFFGALVLGIAFFGFAVGLVIKPTRRRAQALFYASLVYLPSILTLMIVDGR